MRVGDGRVYMRVAVLAVERRLVCMIVVAVRVVMAVLVFGFKMNVLVFVLFKSGEICARDHNG